MKKIKIHCQCVLLIFLSCLAVSFVNAAPAAHASQSSQITLDNERLQRLEHEVSQLNAEIKKLLQFHADSQQQALVHPQVHKVEMRLHQEQKSEVAQKAQEAKPSPVAKEQIALKPKGANSLPKLIVKKVSHIQIHEIHTPHPKISHKGQHKNKICNKPNISKKHHDCSRHKKCKKSCKHANKCKKSHRCSCHAHHHNVKLGPHADVFNYFAGTPVVTSPYLGVRSAYDGHELIVNISSINEDLRLIEQREKMENTLKARGEALPEHPLVELSGKVGALGSLNWPVNDSSTHGDMNIANIELDVVVHMTPWVTGFIASQFDHSQLTPQRAANSKLFLAKGFVTVGNLNACSLYATAGQFFVPFGRGASNMLSAPFPAILGRTKARAALIGYQQAGAKGFNITAYVFRGDSKDTNGTNGQGGANVVYRFADHHMSGEVGASYIASITDSDGMQATGFGAFPGFAAMPGSETLMRRVPAVDVQGKISLGPWRFLGEVVLPTRHFHMTDLSFNGAGAKPEALNVEAAYHFDLAEKPMSIAVGFGHTEEALALNVPHKRYLAAINASFWQNTIATLEYRHDENYAVGNTAAGNIGPGILGVSPLLGKSSDLLSAQFSLYF